MSIVSEIHENYHFIHDLDTLHMNKFLFKHNFNKCLYVLYFIVLLEILYCLKNEI